MEFIVRIYPDGKRVHEVVRRQEGEQCEKIRQYDAGAVVDDEQIGPSCGDSAQEIQNG